MLPLVVGVLFLLSGATSSEIVRLPLRRVALSKEPLLRQGKYLEGEPFKNGRSAVEVLKFYGEAAYFGEISVGTPPQKFTAFYAVSDSDILIPSVKCNAHCGNHTLFDSSKSSTHHSTEIVAHFDTIMGEVSGNLASDTVQVAGLKIQNQTFANINNYKYTAFDSEKYDVIVGLGVKGTTAGGSRALLYQMHNQKLIPKPSFSMYLSDNTNSTNGGSIIFGGEDPTLYTPPLTYTKVTSETRWEFNMDKIAVENKSFCKDGCRAMIDTSSSVIIGPAVVVKQIMKQIGARYRALGFYGIKCSAIPKLPDIIFIVNNIHYTLEPKRYVDEKTHNMIGSCTLKIVGLNVGKPGPVWVLGTPFLTKYYTSFDSENRQLGFAKAISR